MWKVGLTAIATAAACFAFGARAAAPSDEGRLFLLRSGDRVSMRSDNFHCSVLATNQVACGGPYLLGSVQVYFFPHKLRVVKVGAASSQTLFTSSR